MTAIDVTETHFLECRSYRGNAVGTVAYYVINALPKQEGVPKVIHVTPRELASHNAFKMVLLRHSILYTASRSEHGKNLMQLFKVPPQSV